MGRNDLDAMGLLKVAILALGILDDHWQVTRIDQRAAWLPVWNTGQPTRGHRNLQYGLPG